MQGQLKLSQCCSKDSEYEMLRCWKKINDTRYFYVVWSTLTSWLVLIKNTNTNWLMQRKTLSFTIATMYLLMPFCELPSSYLTSKLLKSLQFIGLTFSNALSILYTWTPSMFQNQSSPEDAWFFLPKIEILPPEEH